jgi:hypothetical protein
VANTTRIQKRAVKTLADRLDTNIEKLTSPKAVTRYEKEDHIALAYLRAKLGT